MKRFIPLCPLYEIRSWDVLAGALGLCFRETLSQVCAEHPAEILDKLALPAA